MTNNRPSIPVVVSEFLEDWTYFHRGEIPYATFSESIQGDLPEALSPSPAQDAAVNAFIGLVLRRSRTDDLADVFEKIEAWIEQEKAGRRQRAKQWFRGDGL